MPLKRPDLAIYSQQEQLALGLLPSWDNSDITTNDWGPFRLKNEAIVKVRNLSPNVPASNGLVHFYTAPFGIGTRKTLKQSRLVNVSANQEITLTFPLDQQTLSGDQRIGVHIVIEHPRDSKLLNNFGSQVHNGAYTTESGRSFVVRVPVFNDSPLARTINLSVLPTDMFSSATPSTHNFAPYEQLLVNLDITVPGSITGAPGNEKFSQVTLVGRLADNTLVGGATHLLRINN